MITVYEHNVQRLINESGADVCVCIPVYKEAPDTEEDISLRQCLNVLTDSRIILFVPESLDVSVYMRDYDFDESNIVRFEDKYFEGPESYSELLLSPFFYEVFLNYKYILIYQLDAYVFRNDLDKWVKKGYDYIGAPWYGAYFPNSLEFRKGLPIWRSNLRVRKLIKEPDRRVGNGGFSLRKTKSAYKNLKRFRRKCLNWHCREYEDTFFSIAIPNLNPYYKIPDESIAKYFSLELKAREKLQEMNELPFGCHAWLRHDKALWEENILNNIQ